MLTNINKNEPMGYVYINETSNEGQVSNVITESKADIFYITFDTNLQDFDVENRNHRYYDAANVMSCINNDERIQSLLASGGWFGEFDHPEAVYHNQMLSPRRLQNVPPECRAFKIMQPHLVGNVLKAKIQSAQGAVGESFGKEVLAGWIPQFSARAIAAMVNKNGKPYVNVRKLITYDAPWFPSHRCAHATSRPKVTTKSFEDFGMMAESAIDSASEEINGVMVPLKDILENVGNTDVNANAIMEAFDLPMENLAGFTPDRRKVIIKDENNVIYANIKPDTVKKVNKFFESF